MRKTGLFCVIDLKNVKCSYICTIYMNNSKPNKRYYCRTKNENEAAAKNRYSDTKLYVKAEYFWNFKFGKTINGFTNSLTNTHIMQAANNQTNGRINELDRKIKLLRRYKN